MTEIDLLARRIPMTGQAHWFTLIPLLVGGLGISWLVLREAKEARRYVLEMRRFRCPNLTGVVEATLVREALSRQAIGVRRCSAFADPEAVVCDRACVAGLQQGTGASPPPAG
jgi:hypothetical protein